MLVDRAHRALRARLELMAARLISGAGLSLGLSGALICSRGRCILFAAHREYAVSTALWGWVEVRGRGLTGMKKYLYWFDSIVRVAAIAWPACICSGPDRSHLSGYRRSCDECDCRFGLIESTEAGRLSDIRYRISAFGTLVSFAMMWCKPIDKPREETDR